MEILGFLATILMGILLGLVGGGGSILTVPILVYLFRIDPVPATTYSLFVVGVTSLAGTWSHFRKGNMHLPTALVFGPPSVVAVLVVRAWVLPAIPGIIWTTRYFVLTKSGMIMILFAMLMLLAAVTMIRKPRRFANRSNPSHNYPVIFLEGLLVGGVTGLVGAGGGFLIIPALVLLAGLPMKQAVGTSLLIIAVKSLAGFAGDMGLGLSLNYGLLGWFSVLSIGGILLGSYLTRYVSNEKLRPAFGWFVLVLGSVILALQVMPVKSY